MPRIYFASFHPLQGRSLDADAPQSRHESAAILSGSHEEEDGEGGQERDVEAGDGAVQAGARPAYTMTAAEEALQRIQSRPPPAFKVRPCVYVSVC